MNAFQPTTLQPNTIEAKSIEANTIEAMLAAEGFTFEIVERCPLRRCVICSKLPHADAA